MSTVLFPMRSLLRDRAFIISAMLSVVVTVLFVSIAVHLLDMDRINITKIAEVSTLEPNQILRESGIEAKPISGIFRVADVDFSNPRAESEISNLKSQIWHGYLVTLETFCRFSHTYDQKVGVWISGHFTPLHDLVTMANVIVKTGDKITAGVINIGPKTCEIAKNVNGNDRIYIASDAPVSDVESTPTYLSVLKIDK